MNLSVFFSAPSWGLNGVNVSAARLSRALAGMGVRSKILITNPGRRETKPMPPLSGVEFEIFPKSSLAARREFLVRLLESHAPCVYLPQYDWECAPAVSLLSSRVGVAAVLHSDDPEYYDAARRWGRFWDVAVAVSRRVAEEAARRCPTLPVEVIPHAVPCPVEVTARPRRPGTLKMIYAGALKRYQKRIFDLLHIARSLNRAGIDYRLTVAGGGPDEASFLRSARGLPGVHPVGTVPPDAMSDLYREHDVFLLPSDFEGFPLALAEAMAQGCVPVVRDIASGVPELVRDGENGFVIPHGRPEIFTERLVSLARQPGTLNERSANAHRTILENFSDERRWAGRYLDLFEKCLARRATERRADGRAVSPPVFPIYRREAWKRRLSELWRGGWKR